MRYIRFGPLIDTKKEEKSEKVLLDKLTVLSLLCNMRVRK